MRVSNKGLYPQRKPPLFRGDHYLSVISEIKAIAFDKTGTLTKGQPIVTDYYFNEDEKNIINILVSMEK